MRPAMMFRWGVYASVGVLATVAAAEDREAAARLEPANEVSPSPAAGSPGRADGHTDGYGRTD